jgi:hypothetical protein
MNKRLARIQAPREEDLRQADWERRQEEATKTAHADQENA